MKIGVLSDTHSYLHPAIFDFFADCDQLWHCGDIGNIETLEKLQNFKPLRAVFGNIDGQQIRKQCKETEIFSIEQTLICMTHIGGHPKKYSPNGLQLIKQYKPALFVCGHSHILRVMFDKANNLLYINPGAAGKEGFHTHTTFLRFELNNNTPSNMEVFSALR